MFKNIIRNQPPKCYHFWGNYRCLKIGVPFHSLDRIAIYGSIRVIYTMWPIFCPIQSFPIKLKFYRKWLVFKPFPAGEFWVFWLYPGVPYITLHYIPFHSIALHCIALHWIALHCIALHCIALHCIALDCIALHCIALHCIALHDMTWHGMTWHDMTWHDMTLHRYYTQVSISIYLPNINIGCIVYIISQ